MAGAYSRGDRIVWLHSSAESSMTEEEACTKVVGRDEYFDICGTCDPQLYQKNRERNLRALSKKK